ncbi:MAG: phosphatidylglycerol lysyltransferase domain-containing protein [Planctomycetaceae bacterium]
MSAPPPATEPKVCLRSSLSAEERRAVEHLAYQYGEAAESYLIVEPDEEVLLLPNLAGAAAIVRGGCEKFINVPGGMLAPTDDAKLELLLALRNQVSTKVKVVNCYSVLDKDIPLYERAGYQINKFGEEPVLELGDIDWKGKPYEWLRRQQHYCERNGVMCEEVDRTTTAPEEWEVLKAQMFTVHRDDLRDRPYPHELLLLEGRLMPDFLGRRRLFVARNRNSPTIEAFLIANPMRGGQEWGFESYRRRRDATRGVMAYLMKSTIDKLQQEGVEQVDFCVVPGAGTREKSHPSESRLVQRAVDLWYRRLDFLMGFQGQEYFKSRFRPRMINRYVCAAPHATMGSIMSFLRMTGAFSPSYTNVMKSIAHRIKAKFHRHR